MIQQVFGAVLRHCAACMSIKYSIVSPLRQLSSQMGHAGVGVLHLSPPTLHASDRIVHPQVRAPLKHMLLQDGMIQVWARYRVVLIRIVLLPGPLFLGSAFEEEGDHLLRLFDELAKERGYLDIAGPPGCPHHPAQSVLKLPAGLGCSTSPPGAPPPALSLPQQVQCSSLAVAPTGDQHQATLNENYPVKWKTLSD